jgi:hypothetical protein
MKSISELSQTFLLDVAMVLHDIQEEININPNLKTFRIEPFPFNEHLLSRREIGGGNVTDEELIQARSTALNYLFDEGIIYDVEVHEEEKHDPAGFLYNETLFYDVTPKQEKFTDYSTRVWRLAMPISLESSRRLHKQRTSGEVTKTARLHFDNDVTPLVTVDDVVYVLPDMRDGKAFHIINYCLKNRPNRSIRLDLLKKELEALKIPIGAEKITNIREELRKSIFGIKNALSVFVIVSPQSITVKPETPINNSQLEKIVKVSVKKYRINSE